MAAVMSSAAQWERRLIGQRTKDALAEKRAQGTKLGRPPALPHAVVQRVLEARNAGNGWSAIARQLNTEQVATAHGGTRWYPSTVRAVALANEAHDPGGGSDHLVSARGR
jgi:DNA invertase Pin-like site-specific DNA recombinase